MKEIIDSILDIPRILKIAEIAAKEAGNYLIKKAGHAKIEYQKSSRDDLLDADLGAEKIILTKLREETPHLGILSEEAGHEGRKDQYWIIDPLDGSANFQHSSPTFAVAIALVVNEVTVGSVIHIPTQNEMFTAIRNHGAYLNGTSIQVSNTNVLEKAIIYVGDFTKEDDPEAIEKGINDFSKLVRQVKRIRMIGTAATDLAYVACGRADGLINHATDPWDVEPGKLLLLEAGGKFTSQHRNNGKPLFIYTNNSLHQITTELLKD